MRNNTHVHFKKGFNMYLSKTHLLAKVRALCDKKTLMRFAEYVDRDSLNPAKIKTKGNEDQILDSLMDAPKAVLEEAFHHFFGDENDDENVISKETEEEEEEDDFETDYED